MKAIIVEDEQIASNRLRQLIGEVAPDISIVDVISSVEKGIAWFDNHNKPDLIFLDIQLNDGYGFDILDKLEEHPPVIFTTAYNEYAIRGFKYKGMDYLLKPIDKLDLQRALDKFRQSPYQTKEQSNDKLSDFKTILTKEYKQRFMVKIGNHFSSFKVEQIAYFFSSEGTNYLVLKENKKYPIEYTLDQLDEILNPIAFYRINRKYIVSVDSIKEIHQYFNSRLLLKVIPKIEEEIIVSRERCTDFKQWLDL